MKNIVVTKSYNFAIRIVNLYKYITKNDKEFVMSKQVLKSGTSIGANIAEAQDAQSKNDFISKLNIALKETSETLYWLNLLHDTNYISDDEFDSLLQDCTELKKLLSSILLTLKNDDI